MPAPAPAWIRHLDDGPTARLPIPEKPSVLSFGGSQRPASPTAIREPACEITGAPTIDPPAKWLYVRILGLLAKGETNEEIARHLILTEATIKVYVRELMRHFHSKNCIQVALKGSSIYAVEPLDVVAANEPAETPALGAILGALRR